MSKLTSYLIGGGIVLVILSATFYLGKEYELNKIIAAGQKIDSIVVTVHQTDTVTVEKPVTKIYRDTILVERETLPDTNVVTTVSTLNETVDTRMAAEYDATDIEQAETKVNVSVEYVGEPKNSFRNLTVFVEPIHLTPKFRKQIVPMPAETYGLWIQGHIYRGSEIGGGITIGYRLIGIGFGRIEKNYISVSLQYPF